MCGVIYTAMSIQELFVAEARKSLCTGRKSLSAAQSLDLAALISAVDLGLKPALLYDSNSASSEQVQQYLSSLQSSQLVSNSLLTLDLNGNTLIVNPVTVRSNLELAHHNKSMAVVDVCHSLEKPILTDLLKGELKRVIEDLLPLLTETERPLYVGEKCEEWNLSTVFGLLLGYPVTYWFNQTKSFENCLSMTPLMVTTATASWQADAGAHRCCMYSFSVPTVLLNETQSNLEDWDLCLREKFEHQNVFKDLAVCQTTITLPSVCL